ncbi:non-hydrolyzing UDP-N-acetylglucosamine 2-epimerase [Siccirubricoccus sp. G192]|uniref:non-hydrolyzing UDP-N-acetylglucosamine 2-epimerase n=1 Tax=Siccirubricoccus sp. G192 TaxID=2849651 RepID=UPI001C2C6B33|nr:UDP-N-acetylglucosamine 2-epimerase (non-hydrolyzing) [Siccirubricoccus sp. G192]MBV1798741.1 UDP-N-acetylglucosamine 2-epimerase (non-hydrolyzing) [Siccirubricoccus sp. G192]
MVVFGTRPEAIKMLPVIAELRKRPTLAVIACSTGQHREMLQQVTEAFAQPCDMDLGIMVSGQGLTALTSRVLLAMSEVLERDLPDLVLVHGDTTTAMAAAVASFYAGIPVGHVEAGLRSFDLQRPWPEEFNRVTVDSIATLMFAPTETAAANLRREYNQSGRILVTGNTGIDALLTIAARLESDKKLEAVTAGQFRFLDPSRRLVLVTGHRRESFGAGFEGICEGLAEIAERDDVEIVYPVHLNPNVRAVVHRKLAGRPNLHLIEPVGYVEMVWLMTRATVLVTDSGGLQEEGPALGKPVLVMRDVTERPEALASGVVKLIGTDPRKISSSVSQLIDDPVAYASMARRVFPYGDGHAAQRIVDAVEDWMCCDAGADPKPLRGATSK